MANRHYDGEELHKALCEALGIEDGRGAKKEVRETLTRLLKLDREISKQTYTNITTGTQGSVDTVLDWCKVAEIDFSKLCDQDRATFVPRIPMPGDEAK